MASEKQFPIQLERGAAAHPRSIPWSVAEKAYSVYAAKYGTSQSLERLADRGGFCPGEMDEFLPSWREECSEIAALRRQLADAITENHELREQLASHCACLHDGRGDLMSECSEHERLRIIAESVTWQPIDTAPKEGFIFLTRPHVLTPVIGRWFIYNAYANPEDQQGYWITNHGGTFEPTHWMSLLAPLRTGEGT